MNCLSAVNCNRWRERRGLPSTPYGRAAVDGFCYCQYELRGAALQIASALRQLIEESKPFEAGLLEILDWSLYQKDQMSVMQAIRAANPAAGTLMDFPGHEFDKTECDLLVGMFCLVALYEWSAYLYLSSNVVLYCWEGQRLDIWFREETCFEIFQSVMKKHQMNSTSEWRSIGK